jgi:hypothetical protein
MIQHQRDRYQWEFAFHGCDERGLAQAAELGYHSQNVLRTKRGRGGAGVALSDMQGRSISYRSGKGYN